MSRLVSLHTKISNFVKFQKYVAHKSNGLRVTIVNLHESVLHEKGFLMKLSCYFILSTSKFMSISYFYRF